MGARTLVTKARARFRAPVWIEVLSDCLFSYLAALVLGLHDKMEPECIQLDTLGS